MKNNKKLVIGIIIASALVLLIGTAALAAGCAKKAIIGPNRNNTEEYIGEEEAKQIALDHAGLAEDEVSFIKTKLDYEDRIAEYEIEFYKENTEYDYSIDASTGTIRSYDYDTHGQQSSDVQPDSQQATPDDTAYIEESAAIQTALDHAGLTESEVTRLSSKFDYDNGQAEYEVEFWVGRTEYDYEINAVTGEIIHYNKEIDK